MDEPLTLGQIRIWYLSGHSHREAVHKHHIVGDLKVRHLEDSKQTSAHIMLQPPCLHCPHLTWPLQNVFISSALELWPFLSLMEAHTCSPNLSSFTPTTWNPFPSVLCEFNFHPMIWRRLWRLCSVLQTNGPAPHLHLLYFWMLEEKLFYLCRVDVLPSSDDHIPYPTFNPTVSQTVHAGRVAAVKNE